MDNFDPVAFDFDVDLIMRQELSTVRLRLFSAKAISD
jgi:hypothetical protein